MRLSLAAACCSAGLPSHLAAAPTTATAQAPFTDDAGRSVVLPARIDRVFAAGAPAELLLYTLAPEKLPGRNNVPSSAALELMPPEYRTARQIASLPERDDPRYDAELLALDVDVYVDYGTVDGDYVAALEAISARTGIPGIILDGSLENIPAVYRRLSAALGVPERGERLAGEAERIIDKYRGALADPPVRVYLACSQNGLTPCVEGHSSGRGGRTARGHQRRRYSRRIRSAGRWLSTSSATGPRMS